MRMTSARIASGINRSTLRAWRHRLRIGVITLPLIANLLSCCPGNQHLVSLQALLQNRRWCVSLWVYCQCLFTCFLSLPPIGWLFCCCFTDTSASSNAVMTQMNALQSSRSNHDVIDAQQPQLPVRGFGAKLASASTPALSTLDRVFRLEKYEDKPKSRRPVMGTSTNTKPLHGTLQLSLKCFSYSYTYMVQNEPSAGLEPAIPGLGGRCRIHWATRAACLRRLALLNLHQLMY